MVSASSRVEGSSGQPLKCASTRTLPSRSGEVSSRCLSRMTFFSYSCASFGWPVIGPATSTIFFGRSAAKSTNGQRQNGKANEIQSRKSLQRLIGDAASVDPLHRETRTRIRDQRKAQLEYCHHKWAGNISLSPRRRSGEGQGREHLQNSDVNRGHEPDWHPSPCPLPARRGGGGRRPGGGRVMG